MVSTIITYADSLVVTIPGNDNNFTAILGRNEVVVNYYHDPDANTKRLKAYTENNTFLDVGVTLVEGSPTLTETGASVNGLTDIDDMYGALQSWKTSLLNPGCCGSTTVGDKGDITVSGTGDTWTIDNGAVTINKLGGTISSYAKTLLEQTTEANLKAYINLESTTDLPEGTNLYFTEARVLDILDDYNFPGTGTNLSYTASSTNGIVTSDTGTDATIPLVTGTNAGLMSPTDYTKLLNIGAGIPAGGTAGQILTKVDGTNYNVTWQDNYADWTSVVKHIVKNGSGVVIPKGTPIYSTGSDGTNILVAKASNASEATSSKTMGLTQTQLTTSGSNQTGFVITEGLLGGLDTQGTTAGDPVWLGANGALIYGLTNKPYAPAHLVFIGIVTKVSNGNGEIFVKVQNGFELDELHNVDLKTTTPINGHILGYDNTLWVNKTIAGWLGFTPEDSANKQNNLTASSTKYPTVDAVNTGLATKQNTLTLTTTGTSGAATLTGSTLNIPQYPNYTFSTGLTNITGTITSNLSVGVENGQSVIGGSRVNENLTLSSTSNPTKGKILFGNSTYDELNNKLGLGTVSPSYVLDVNNGGLGVTAGTLSNGGNIAFNLSATMPSTITAPRNAINLNITSAGSSAFANRAFNLTYNSGYTGSASTIGGFFTNSAAGTGSEITGNSNFGLYAQTNGTTTGTNIGSLGYAANGDINIGISGQSIIDKDSSVNIGVLGLSSNKGSSPTQVGGYFGFGTLNPIFTSAALICDNGGLSDDIFVAKTDGVSQFTIASNGDVNSVGTITVPNDTYSSAWDTNYTVPTKNAIYNKIESFTVLTNLNANSIVGNNTGTAGSAIALTGTQVTAMLNTFTSSLKGLVPASSGGTTNFLRADGTWAVPSGGGGGGGTTYTFSTGLAETSGTVTANLSTGVSGGQSVVGGTAASNSLTLSSTTDSTKGRIIFGTSAYNESTNRLGIGTTSPTRGIDCRSNARILETNTATTGTSDIAALDITSTISPTTTSSASNRALNMSNTFNAPSINFTGSINAGWFENRIINASTINELIGNFSAGLWAANTAVTLTSVTTASAAVFQGVNSFSNSLTSTVTNINGISIVESNKGTLTLTNVIGINLANQTSGTNNTNILIGTGTTGNWSIYNNSTNNNYFNGNLYIGSTSNTGFKLDVTGTARASTSLDTPTLRGGTGASGNLTLSSTSNATKGKLLFGTSAYDEANNRLGIVQTSPTSRLHINANQNAVTQSDANGILLANSTAATVGVQSISPPIVLQGNGWATTGAASQDVRFRIDVLPAQSATNPTGSLRIMQSINNAVYSNALTITSWGELQTNSAYFFGGSCYSPQFNNAQTTAVVTYKTTNSSGTNITAAYWSGSLNTTAGTKSLQVDGNNNGLVFTAANGTNRISRAAIDITNLVNTAGSESADLIFSTQSGGTAVAEKFRISSGGNFTFFDGGNFIFGTGTGTKIGTANNQKLSFWNALPIAQPATGGASATLASNAGTTLTDTDTFDGYTLQQVVKALRNIGLLA